ncbi:MAG: hypothetical protein ACMG6E_04570 [Candidatus Roizmanbacteria bacterium]
MLIILNGPINAGKSTIAKLLSEMILNTAHVEVDKIREFISWMEGSEGWNMSFEAAIPLAKKFIEKGLNVIIAYHISKDDYQKIVDELGSSSGDMYAFTLRPTMELLLQNRGSREIGEREINKIKDTYNREMYQSHGEIIDNTHQTPEQTAKHIYNKVKDSIK